MMRIQLRTLATIAVAAALCGCGARSAVVNRVSIDFPADPKRVRINTVTELRSDPSSKAMADRLHDVREAIGAGRDEWTLRYAAIEVEDERLIIDRHHGEITRMERLATMERDALPRFFGDTSMNVSLTRINGVSELTIVPGSSTRATRKQREHVTEVLDAWSKDAARYVVALSRLYQFIDNHPQKAGSSFKLLLGDRSEKSTSEEEQALVEAVWNAMDNVMDHFDAHEEAFTVNEEFDLVFNPFPAEILIHVPRTPTAVENFVNKDGTLQIRHAGLLDAIESLDGKWISPDPLSARLHDDEPDPQEFARSARRWTPDVSASEIEAAVMQQLKPSIVYRVRWND